jgi:mycoredoxin
MSLSRELYGTAGCPYTRELREHLELEGHEFVEFDIDADPRARERLDALTGGTRMVPVLVEDGRVASVGWHGRGCAVAPARKGPA